MAIFVAIEEENGNYIYKPAYIQFRVKLFKSQASSYNFWINYTGWNSVSHIKCSGYNPVLDQIRHHATT